MDAKSKEENLKKKNPVHHNLKIIFIKNKAPNFNHQRLKLKFILQLPIA
jgi:hypothetical protein